MPPRANDKVADYILEDAIIGLAYMRGYVSPALLQRDMGLSYPVAARLLDTLEDRNIIQRDSGKPRWTLNDAWRHE